MSDQPAMLVDWNTGDVIRPATTDEVRLQQQCYPIEIGGVAYRVNLTAAQVAEADAVTRAAELEADFREEQMRGRWQVDFDRAEAAFEARREGW